MQTQNRFLDDLARVAAGAMGSVFGIRQELEGRFREQIERMLSSMDVVSREEFEAVRLMAATARREQEILAARLGALEARLGGGAAPPVWGPDDSQWRHPEPPPGWVPPPHY